MAAAAAASRRPGASGRLLIVGSGIAVTLAVASCGSADDNPYGLSAFRGTAGTGEAAARPSASASASQAVSPSPVPSGPAVQLPPAPGGALDYPPSDTFGEGAWVERGTIAAASRARKEVVDAAVAFMSARVRLSNTWQIDEPALEQVASGQALSNMRERAQTQQDAQRRSVGRFVLNVSSVRISDDTAVLSGCSYDGTVEVSTQGSLLSDAPGGIVLAMDLQRRADQWRVTTFPAQKTYCRANSRADQADQKASG